MMKRRRKDMANAPRKRKEKPSAPEFIRVSEAARVLDVNRNTIYRGIDAGLIPAVKVGGRVYRIPAAWLEAAKAGL